MASDTATHPDSALIALIDEIARHQDSAPERVRAEAALRALYDRTSSKLYGVALRVVGNREWAEDVLQEAYLNIWRIAGDYRVTLSPPMAWMGVIALASAMREPLWTALPRFRRLSVVSCAARERLGIVFAGVRATCGRLTSSQYQVRNLGCELL